ncbi:hypothetical protein TNCV_1642381 [Trichonephila clavipes]|nr:hypothetical protein TNCV_1642381 [Trichonephila clavipes]
MHRHTGPVPGIMVWSSVGFHCRTPLVRMAATMNSQCYISEILEPVVLPYIQRLLSSIFQQDNALPHMALNVPEFFFTHQIELLPWSAVLPIYHQSKTCSPCLHTNWPRMHHPLLHQIHFGNIWKPHGLQYHNDTSKASLIPCRGVWQRS